MPHHYLFWSLVTENPFFFSSSLVVVASWGISGFLDEQFEGKEERFYETRVQFDDDVVLFDWFTKIYQFNPNCKEA